MNMAEDQVDAVVEGSSNFGEVSERDAGDEGTKPVLVEDKAKSESTEEESEDTTEGKTEGESTEESEEGTEEADKETEEGEEELTELGTKLDKNPQSRVHQELANERKIRGQMEQVLKSPELIARFMKDQYGVEVPVKGSEKPETATEVASEEPEVKEYKAEDFENLDDVASTINGMQKTFLQKQKDSEAKIEKLTGVISALVDGGKKATVASNIKTGVDSLRIEKELNPNDPEFIEGLEEKIAARFNQLDYDEQARGYRGQYKIEDIGKEILDAIRMGRKAGSKKAQTIVKDKTSGKIKTSESVTDEVDSDNLKPGDSIALGVAKMFKR